MNSSPKRIHIIGTGGSGKTTLARQLAAILKAPCPGFGKMLRFAGGKRQ